MYSPGSSSGSFGNRSRGAPGSSSSSSTPPGSSSSRGAPGSCGSSSSRGPTSRYSRACAQATSAAHTCTATGSQPQVGVRPVMHAAHSIPVGAPMQVSSPSRPHAAKASGSRALSVSGRQPHCHRRPRRCPCTQQEGRAVQSPPRGGNAARGGTAVGPRPPPSSRCGLTHRLGADAANGGTAPLPSPGGDGPRHHSRLAVLRGCQLRGLQAGPCRHPGGQQDESKEGST